MLRRAHVLAWSLSFSFLLNACYLKPVPDVLPQVDPAALEAAAAGIYSKIEFDLWAAPEVAPEGVMRKLWVGVYMSPADAQQLGLSQVNLSVEGQAIGSVALEAGKQTSVVYLEWMPPAQAPGGGAGAVEYTVNATLPELPGMPPAEARLCVIYGSSETLGYVQGDGAASCLPAQQSTGPAVPEILSAYAELDHADCWDVGIIFTINVKDPDHNIAYAFIKLENWWIPKAGVGNTEGKPTQDAPGRYSFYEAWSPSNLEKMPSTYEKTIKWTANLLYLGPGNQYLLTSKGPYSFVFSVPICDAVSLPPPDVIFKPRLPEGFPRRAPESDADCPAGTFFAPGLRICMLVQAGEPDDEERERACPAGQTLVCYTSESREYCECQ